MHKVDRDALTTEPARAPDPVQVRLGVGTVVRVERQVIVDDHVDLHHVDPARDHVGRDQDLCLALSERLHDGVAFLSLEFAVQRDYLVTFGRHASGNLVGRVAFLMGTNPANHLFFTIRRKNANEKRRGRGIELTLTKMILCPIVRRLYSSTNTSYLCPSSAQSTRSRFNNVRGGVSASPPSQERSAGEKKPRLYP